MNRHILQQLLRTGCILILLAETAAAQTMTVITGRVADRPVKSVSLSYWYDPGISPAITQDTLLKQDSFYFRIPLTAGRQVFFYADAGGGYNFYGLIRAGDSLHIRMQGDSLFFSGGGAVVCRVMYMATREQARIAVPSLGTAAALAVGYRQQLLAGSRILAAYRDSMSRATWSMINAHVQGETAAKLVSTLWKLPAAPDSTMEERQVRFYQQEILPALPVIVPSDTTAMAIRYLGYLLQKAEADYFIQHRYECNNRAIYEWLKMRYSGRFRDKLLAHALTLGFAAGNQQEEQEWCVRDYLSAAQDEACKQAIGKLYGRSKKGISKGSTAPAFTFQDQHGRPVSLQQFSGKVVLLHFYNSTDALLSVLSEIKTCFDDNTVSFVNICCNGNTVKDLPGWLLQLDEQHADLLTQYNISKYPSLIVVGKNGKIYATRPPDPLSDHGTALTNIIYEALLQ
ncbi:TlpA family protein disulfide reductase [Chitinophaga hostae]|uniref:TlpA family protein disulfide reductase n=1 Tax=Chitinophaga hostae TaxID=2831022 RepID=UPI003F6A0F1A